MPTHIAQRTLVHCPAAQAAGRLNAYMRELGGGNGDAAQLSLFIQPRVPGLSADLRLERAVRVTLKPRTRSSDMTPHYAIHWESAEPGPFPTFDGELRVENDEDYDAFALVVEGSYEPPFGLLGESFDRIVGARIAATCTRNLVAGIAEAVESAFAADEARKVAASVRSASAGT